MKLNKTSVQNGFKSRSENNPKRLPPREGYADENGQVFSIPKSVKRVSAWILKMREKGFEID